jgi:four helix bundle protein
MNAEKPFDLGERTVLFSLEVAGLMNQISATFANLEFAKRALRASASIGANYNDANENKNDKDAVFKFKACRKESLESNYYLRLLQKLNPEFTNEFEELIEESTDLKKIFGSITKKKQTYRR